MVTASKGVSQALQDLWATSSVLRHTPVLDVVGLLGVFLVLMTIYRQGFREMQKWHHRKRRSHQSAAPERGTRAELEVGLIGASSSSSDCFDCFLVIGNYYTPLYAFCAYLMYLEFRSAFAILSWTNYLDPARLRANFGHEEALPDWWGHELQYMHGDAVLSMLLRYFSLLSPISVSLTFMVSAYNTFRHVKDLHQRRGCLVGNPGVDSTIIIVALPLVACLMAFRCVTRMWMICANSTLGSLSYAEDFNGQHTWVARVALCRSYFKTNLAMTDVYESWALLHFASLSLKVINAHTARKVTKIRKCGVAGVKRAMCKISGVQGMPIPCGGLGYIVEANMDASAPEVLKANATLLTPAKSKLCGKATGTLQKTGIEDSAGWADCSKYFDVDALDLEQQQSLLSSAAERYVSKLSKLVDQSALRRLTHQGIYLFNLTCVLEAAYCFLGSLFQRFNGTHPMMMTLDHDFYLFKDKAHYFFLGMGTISSSAAISNVVTVECEFEHSLKRFRPFSKFWSTKILVTLAFLQSLVLELPPLCYLSSTEQSLVYASALSIECFFISLLHLKAWKPGEEWYNDLRENLTQEDQS